MNLDMPTEEALEVLREINICDYCSCEIEGVGGHGKCPNCGNCISCGD